jgi:hypothetical protein
LHDRDEVPVPRNADETHASHQVMELVRSNSALSLLVVQLRVAGKSWRGVKTAIEAEIARRRPQAPRELQGRHRGAI